ncbi:MAG: CbiX/SirB N-terminal domain-containing protein [Dehalococcoidales bacterium]|nr:CbiX/SirB N-terminal domain-containing protein [Dehalococcoidales bacterium]
MKDEFIILATHGSPPRDFPRGEMAEFFRLHSIAESGQSVTPEQSARYQELEEKMRLWPRNSENDPFYQASCALAAEMQKQSGIKVVPGFNEFCAPDISQAIGQAVADGAKKIVVVTPMLTRGGMHAEVEIAQIVEKAQSDHPGLEITYAWPFEITRVASFLLNQAGSFQEENIGSVINPAY